MKKLLSVAILSGLCVTPILADWDLQGQISAVDPAKKTITLQGMNGVNAVIQILPYTQLKGDDCGAFGNDVYGTFADLTVGKFIEAEVYPANAMAGAQQAPAAGGQFVAKEVEWKCYPRAY
ncbi:hypothetical protein CCZ01_09960 [Helicobacter monodelphidis]|nr:hypothetical protein [Helicobacter sp. 15-1451]RAX55513.1 hypothetical protein CCZ01_09960 [Helicobacter sp. 15-1451]